MNLCADREGAKAGCQDGYDAVSRREKKVGRCSLGKKRDVKDANGKHLADLKATDEESVRMVMSLFQPYAVLRVIVRLLGISRYKYQPGAGRNVHRRYYPDRDDAKCASDKKS